MPESEVNLADRSGSLVESHKGYDPRIVFFYFLIAALLITLVGGLARRQLLQSTSLSEKERQQNERRVIIPGPRGNIYDREGRVLVGNKPVFSVVLYIDELRPELRREQIRIRKNYLELDDKDIPSRSELEKIARVSVVQSYLDQVVKILGRDPAGPEAKINAAKLMNHFHSSLLLPYTLLDNLDPADYAKLIEELPVSVNGKPSPLQVYASSSRYYPFGAAAGHTLGFVRPGDEPEDEEVAGDDLQLRTFKLKGALGKGGLELQFDDILQGTPGGSVFRVDPSGFRINPPLEQVKPKQGKSITTSLDIDLQQLAEVGLGDQIGAVVALDVHTGEVLVLASKPDYGDMNEFSPRATKVVTDKIEEAGGWNNLAIAGAFPPGSTFKTVVSVAGLRSGRLNPNDTSVDCQGVTFIGRSRKTCDNGLGHHGHEDLTHAIADSCDIYFYRHGIDDIGPDAIATEARRLHLDQRTGIELPAETKRMLVPDRAWLKKERDLPWTDGYTANMAIGQGDLLVTPMQMACWAASLARGETTTKPYILHDPQRPVQHTEPLGLTAQQRAYIVDGMVGCTTYGTAKPLTNVAAFRVPGVKIAGKTGTAQWDVSKNGQYVGKINFAWFICFAPAENPQVAIALVVKGDTIGENFGGGDNAAPIAASILQKYFQKKTNPGPTISPFQQKPVASVRP
jgi:penicillin-binding protein 2